MICTVNCYHCGRTFNRPVDADPLSGIETCESCVTKIARQNKKIRPMKEWMLDWFMYSLGATGALMVIMALVRKFL